MQHFGQSICRKIIEIVAIRCQTLSLRCTNFDFGWAPDTAGEAHGVSPIPRSHSWISKGLILRRGRKRKKEKWQKKDGVEGK